MLGTRRGSRSRALTASDRRTLRNVSSGAVRGGATPRVHIRRAKRWFHPVLGASAAAPSVGCSRKCPFLGWQGLPGRRPTRHQHVKRRKKAASSRGLSRGAVSGPNFCHGVAYCSECLPLDSSSDSTFLPPVHASVSGTLLTTTGQELSRRRSATRRCTRPATNSPVFWIVRTRDGHIPQDPRDNPHCTGARENALPAYPFTGSERCC